MKLELWPHQDRLTKSLRQAFASDRWLLGLSATGSGKSVIIAFMAVTSANKGNKVLVLSHRAEIIVQNLSKIEMMGQKAVIVNAGTKGLPKDCNICVAQAQTVASRVKRIDKYRLWLASFNFILIDEIHNDTFTPLFDYFSKDAYVCGLSATLMRSGTQTQFGLHFSKIIYEDFPSHLIKSGYLVDAKYYGLSCPDLSGVETSYSSGDYNQEQLKKVYTNKVHYSGVVSNYSNLASGEKAIVFCVGSRQVAELTKQFCDAGYKAKYIISKGAVEGFEEYTGEREQIIRQFKENEIQILVNIDVLSTGFDAQDIQVVVLAMATKSYVKYQQAIGRGCRKYPGKKYFKILDFGKNIETHGYLSDTPKFGLWHNVGKSGIAATKECSVEKGGCGRLIHISAKDCPFCSFHFNTVREEYEIELEEYVRQRNTDPLAAWVAEQVLSGKSNNKILCSALHKNPQDKHKTFLRVIKLLRTNHASNISEKYYHYFIKHVFSKTKKQRNL